MEVKDLATRDGVRVSSISLASPKGGRAEGMLVALVGTRGKTGAIVWMHSGGAYENQP